tara:strand:+ start:384 stop:680 length:297 start_codon:yes stop_codon:yes gene_type:complete
VQELARQRPQVAHGVGDIPCGLDFDYDIEAEEFARKGAVEKIEKVVRQVINDVPEIAGGNKSKITRILQIDYKTMHYKFKEYGLNEWKIVIVLWFTQK